ncbi:MAG: polysaccharide deacetylase family protein [Clostridia bacterium]|nr:polysaccharide deacetylase family protein [Clostridia bacterium]
MQKRKKGVALCAAAATTVAAVCFCVCVGSYATQTAAAQRKLPIYSVAREDKAVAISFDCAWGTEFTDAILDALEKSEVRCTFFAVQFWVEKNPEFAKKIVKAGHELGTHSKTHSYMSKLSQEEIDSELSSSSKAILETTGVKPTLFRAPYGDYDNLLIERAQAQGLYTIQWDVDSLDWKNLSATEIALRIINGVESGSIILCHNNGLHTAEALPMVFSTLKNRGYTFLPIGELIYPSDYKIDHTGKQYPLEKA